LTPHGDWAQVIGAVVCVAGSAIETVRLCCWLGPVLVGVGFWIKLKQEEDLLLRHFPDEYPVYQKKGEGTRAVCHLKITSP
jgi:protein-S-isoprenylcysteine O-methyltransferase Ste14